MLFDNTPRRGFLASLTGLMAASAVGDLRAAETVDSSPVDDHDKWLDGLTGKYRQFFDSSVPGVGLGLIHIRNYFEVLEKSYGAKPNEINAVGTCYGESTPLAWNDAMWKKYKIGATLKLEDPESKAPLERNWYYRPKKTDPVFFNGQVMDASIETLSQRGVVFVMCNMAFNFWVGRLSAAGFGAKEEIAKEIKANLLPGIVVVPAMVVAINAAQRRGLTYMKST